MGLSNCKDHSDHLCLDAYNINTAFLSEYVVELK